MATLGNTLSTTTFPTGGGGGRGSIRFTQDVSNGEGHNIYHGKFFPDNGDWTPNDCRWECWVKPTASGYIVVGGESGLHEVLVGAAVGADTWGVSGNFHSGTPNDNSYTSLDNLPNGEWGHISVGIKDGDIYVHLLGVLSNIVPLEAPRISSGQKLFAGGSDHNGVQGYLNGIRGFENAGAMDNYRRNFAPNHFFTPRVYSFDGTTHEDAVFCVMYDVDSGVYIDISEGFETFVGDGAMKHHGFRNVGKEYQVRNDYGALPEFVAGEYPVAPTIAPAAASVPEGALDFVDFNVAPITPAWQGSGLPGAGIAATLKLPDAGTGSVGVLAWENSSGWGIIDGRAFSNYQSNQYAVRDYDGTAVTTNANISVKRMNNSICQTGITARFVDADNVIYVHGTPTAITIYNRTGGVSTNQSWAASGYEKITLNISGTTAEVFKDAVSLGTFTVTDNGSEKHGLYGNAQLDSIYRFDDYTVKAAS